MSEIKTCPSCGKPLPTDVPLGLCPQCLVKSGLNTGAEPGGERLDFEPPPLAEMARLFPQFEVLGFLGKGGMGAVYQARQPALDRLIALKILPPRLGGDPGFAERFNREARALARLNHPNIVAVYDFGQTGTLNYLAMEFVDGMNLRQIERAGQLSPGQALQIVPQICDALQFAHEEGVVHRDIKPENILIDTKGRVKITDFGIAKIIGATPEKIGLTGARDIVGTPHYMAPEQIETPSAVDHRADIYSLGVVFYEMLTGELPLGNFLPPSSKVQVDVRFDDVVLRALEKEPERRYQHASEVKTATQFIADDPAPPPPIDNQPPSAMPLNERRSAGNGWKIAAIAAVAMLILFVFVVLLVVGFLWWNRKPTTSPSAQAKTGLFNSVASALASVQGSPTLRFHWVADESCVYAVQFQSDTEDETETLAGNVIYTVKELDGDTATLVYRNQMGAPQHHAKPGKSAANLLMPHFWPESPFSPPRQIHVDSTGNIQERSGETKPLPQALGNVEDLVFEPLPPHNQSAWVAEGECVIWQSRFVPLAPRSRMGRMEQTSFSAHEKTSYHLLSTEHGTVQIQKHYELKTQESLAGEPRMQLTGDGTITFDSTLGLPRSMEFNGVFTETTTNTTLRTPITLSYHLLEGQEKTKALEPPTPAKVEPKELTPAELRNALIDLKSADSGRKQLATATLAGAKPAEPRSEVVSALVSALSDSNWAVRQNAARALGVWATTEAFQPLVKVLDDTQFSVRWAAIEALGGQKDFQSADALAKHMTHGEDISQVGQALRAIGTPAEEAVDGLLNEKDQQTRYEACRILKDIGTKKSIPTLTTAASDADNITAMLAKDALTAIDARQ